MILSVKEDADKMDNLCIAGENVTWDNQFEKYLDISYQVKHKFDI